jgi:MFS family permease
VHNAESVRPPRSGWLLISLLGGMFLVSVDIAIANVAAPAIRDNLGASGGALELIVSGYTLAYAMGLITAARLGEQRGYRRMYVAGLAAFTGASLACGLAPTSGVLIAARLVQGAAAAALAAQVLTGLQINFTGPARTRALGLYTAILSGGAVIGQAFGGVLVSADVLGLSWRPIFLINLPIGAALVITAWRCLPHDHTPSGPRHRLDLPGVTTLSAALGLVVAPLVLGREQGWPVWTWISLAAGAGAFVVFGRLEQRLRARGGHPLITIELLGRAPITLALVSLLLASATYFAILLILALYLQQGLGHSASYSGLALVSWVAAFGLAGPLLARLGPAARRLAAPAGALVLGASYATLSGLAAAGQHGTTELIIALGVGGLGWGVTFTATLAHLSAVVPHHGAADISGLFQTTLRVGGTLGVAVFGTVYFNHAPQPDPAAGTHAFATTTLALAITAAAAALAAAVALRDPTRTPRTRRVSDHH